MTTASTTPLPPLYARWIEQSLGHALPSENRATCDDCAMCGNAAERDGTTPDLRFNPTSKCCTFYPDLPNFLVGALLADPTPGLTAKPIVAQFIRERVGATPFGLQQTPAFVARYNENKSRGVDSSYFGHAEDMICPYFNVATGGQCGLWLHRNAVCSTWFCKHRDGALGMRFWDAAALLLKGVEYSLTSWCVVTLIDDGVVLQELFDASGAPRDVGNRRLRGCVDEQGQLAPDLSRRIWGKFYEREIEFYEQCHSMVAGLHWNDVLEKGGPRLRYLEKRMKELLPSRHADASVLCKGQFVTLQLDGNRSRMRAPEAPNEPLELATPLVRALRAFDGRPTEVVLKELAANGMVLDDKLLGELRRRGILVPPDGRDVPPVNRPQSPLTPLDELRLFRGYRGAEPTLVEGKSAQGNRTLSLSCGQRGITVQDATGFKFVRELVRHGQGFRAGEACAWLGLPLDQWAQVQPMLESFLASELLQRIPVSES